MWKKLKQKIIKGSLWRRKRKEEDEKGDEKWIIRFSIIQHRRWGLRWGEWRQDGLIDRKRNQAYRSTWHAVQCSSMKANKTITKHSERNQFKKCKQTWATPSSQPLITSPFPTLNLKGLPRSREESNFLPSVKVPKKKKRNEIRK